MTTLLNSGSFQMDGGMYKITLRDIAYCRWILHKMYSAKGSRPSEDDMQDAMEQMCLAARTFDDSKGVTFTSYARKYLKKSMTYKKTPSLRQSGTPVHSDMFIAGSRYEYDPDRLYGNGSPEKRLILKDSIAKALSTFPERVRTSLVCHYLNDEDYNEIAKDFGYKNLRSLSKHVRDWCKRVQGGAVE